MSIVYRETDEEQVVKIMTLVHASAYRPETSRPYKTLPEKEGSIFNISKKSNCIGSP